MTVAEDVDLAAISEPQQLRTALDQRRVSEGEALVVLLHRIDPKTVEAWVGALPKLVRDDFVEYARTRLAASETLSLGRGISLPEGPSVVEALGAWLLLHDAAYRRSFYRASAPTREVTPTSSATPTLNAKNTLPVVGPVVVGRAA
jgi:hypothetical protein